MGAWDVGIFDNDNAADWLDELQSSNDVSLLHSALEAVEADYLEAPEGASILAASEIIAALKGCAASDLPEEAREWIEQHAGLDVSSLVPLAKQGVDRVLAEDSELNELWRENIDEYPIWQSKLADLKTRLDAQPV